jgi:hypothetical protein
MFDSILVNYLAVLTYTCSVYIYIDLYYLSSVRYSRCTRFTLAVSIYSY